MKSLYKYLLGIKRSDNLSNYEVWIYNRDMDVILHGKSCDILKVLGSFIAEKEVINNISIDSKSRYIFIDINI